MWQSMKIPVLLVMASAMLASCVGRGGQEQQVVRREDNSFANPSARMCLGRLKSDNVRFQSLPNKNNGGGCRTIDTIKLLEFGTETTNLGPMTCPLASNFAAWARYAARPAARVYFGTELARIETFGTYNCRGINGGGGRSGKLSQHAFANAVDVSAFILADGRRISVLSGWRGSRAEREFLRRLHLSACKRFGTVLGPDYNAAHANHFHFDMSESTKDGSTYCR